MRAAVADDDALDDGQAQAHAVALGGEVGFEDAVQILGGNAHAPVGDLRGARPGRPAPGRRLTCSAAPASRQAASPLSIRLTSARRRAPASNQPTSAARQRRPAPGVSP